MPRLPTAEEIREKTAEAIERLDTILADATIEEKRDLVQKYVRAVEAFPETQRVEISLYPALFTGMVAGARYVTHDAFWTALKGLEAA